MFILLKWFLRNSHMVHSDNPQVGENGSGKTTLVKLLTGELTPMDGYRNAHRQVPGHYLSKPGTSCHVKYWHSCAPPGCQWHWWHFLSISASCIVRYTHLGNDFLKMCLNEVLCYIWSFYYSDLNVHMSLLLFRNLKIAHFTQHHVDQLVMDTTSLELIQSRFPGEKNHLTLCNIT